MKKLLIALSIGGCALLLVAGGLYWMLRAPVPSEGDVVGLYTGSKDGYFDQVEIMPDHRFIQTLKKPSGETITIEGTWTLKNRGLLLGDYSFFIDTDTDKALIEPRSSSSFPFTVFPDSLIYDWGSSYYKLTKP
ncbi:hypothetical protein [Luteolibacter sp. AS25]|uniref:hypothetical protein n=1 Tax=Luteolibacter sp. AS25 TaxID=3135776 RepID=UPI00398AE49A